MARKIAEIKQEIGQNYVSNASIQEAYDLTEDAVFENEFSIASFESIVFTVVAIAIWILETIFDTHAQQIDTALFEQKSGTPRWYRNMSLAFQYGFDLLPDSDKFNNEGFTVEQIEASKIVKYCSVKESQESNRLVIKIASETAGELTPISEGQKESFEQYMKEIKYAGVKIIVINNPADKLLLTMAVYRDPLVIDENGSSIINGGKPVETAINEYMKNLPFNGELVLNDLIEYLREVPGVINVNILIANASYYDVVSNSFTDYEGISVKTIPMAGYFEVVNFDNVTYVV